MRDYGDIRLIFEILGVYPNCKRVSEELGWSRKVKGKGLLGPNWLMQEHLRLERVSILTSTLSERTSIEGPTSSEDCLGPLAATSA